MGPCRSGQGRLVLMPQKRSIDSGSLPPAAPPANGCCGLLVYWAFAENSH